MIRLALFDCDGTLVDGQAEVCAAMDAAFAAAGLPAPDRGLVRRSVGLSLPYAMARLAPDADEETHALLDAAYREAYREARLAGRLVEPLYDGIADLLDALRGAGWLLGVATGKSSRGLAHCLATHGLGDHFVTLQTADHHPSKPDPSMVEAALAESGAARGATVMIGDTAYDMAMGRAAGVHSLGVDWGYHETAELVAAGADAVVTSPAELAAHLVALAEQWR